MKQYKVILTSTLFALGLMSCNKFLDTLPDNRIIIKDEEGVQKLLIYAYPNDHYAYFTYLMSDNNCDVYENRSRSDQFLDQAFEWKDITSKENNTPTVFWNSSWNSIYTANVAISELEKTPKGPNYEALKAEALLCRAYNEFMLTNVFGHSYNPQYSDTDLGVPYIKEPIKDLTTRFKRQTVTQNYQDIESDILAALPHVDDKIYKQPKYHFNKKAAYAFATRFYLFKQDWDKTIEMANAVLGEDPTIYLRDWRYLNSINTEWGVRTLEYVNANNKCNLLLSAVNNSLGRLFGYSYEGMRYSHNTFISAHQTVEADAPWGSYYSSNMGLRPTELTTPFIRVMYPKYPTQFEYIDVVAQIGYLHTTAVSFTGDEVLLSRAEAYVHKGMYTEALRDMNTWLSNFTQGYPELTDEKITQWNENTPYNTVESPTPRSQFHADFPVEEGKQEHYLQVVLHMRRLQTLQEGLRWFDVKRYGIEYERYRLRNASDVEPLGNVLNVRDPRRAVQLPVDVIAAGMEANPR